MPFTIDQQDWLDKIRKKYSSSSSRPNHLHFDPRITTIRDEVAVQVTNPEWVSQHKFLPFIRSTSNKKRYKRIQGSRIRQLLPSKKRPIDAAAHIDSLIYSWYAHQLSLPYEKELSGSGLSDVILAYRKNGGLSTMHHAGAAFDFFQNHPTYVAHCYDVSQFFESLDHAEIKSAWAQLLNTQQLPDDHYRVFRSITNYSFTKRSSVMRSLNLSHEQTRDLSRFCSPKDFLDKIVASRIIEKNKSTRLNHEGGRHQPIGVPQGTALSCVLANIYLLKLDKLVATEATALGAYYRRYSDDIILIMPQEHASKIVELLKYQAELVHLKIKEEKTELRHLISTDGRTQSIDTKTLRPRALSYLGLEFDGQRIRLRHAGIAKFQRRRNRAIHGTISRLKPGRHAPIRMYRSNFTHDGLHTYLSYGRRAERIVDSSQIRAQIKTQKIERQLKQKVRTNLERLSRKQKFRQ